MELEVAPSTRPLDIAEASVASLRDLLKQVVQWRMPQVADEDIGVVFYQGQDVHLAMNTLKEKPKYPFFAVSVTAMNVNSAEGLNAAALQRVGINASLVDSRNEVMKLHLIPITIDCSITFVSQSFQQTVSVGLSWLEISDKLEPRVSLTDPEFSLPIRPISNSGVTFPDSKDDDTSSYKTQFQLTLHTHTGFAEIVPTVRTVTRTIVAAGTEDQYNMERSVKDVDGYNRYAVASRVVWNIRDRKRVI